MTNKQYEQLRQVIIKANPDIIKLEFGCRFIDSAKNQYYIGCEGRLFEEFGDGMECDPELTDSLENIGRMITLTDVLIALAKNNIVSELEIFVDVMGRFWNIESCGGKNEMKIVGRWDLKNNNLKNQSQPTVDFLHKLLCVKK